MKLDWFRSWLKAGLTEEQRDRLQEWANRSRLFGWLYRADLRALATLYASNKWRDHWYAQHYQTHLRRFRKRPVNVLEIGVGGFADPRSGGAALRMWKAFFRKGRIYGIDTNDKSLLEEPRIRIFQGSQADPEFLRWVIEQIGRIDIIVDAGSHLSEHVIASFQVLFPALAEGGIYAIEDLQTSYWSEFGGSEDPHCEFTSMALCKRLVDGLNWQEYETREPSLFDGDIVGIHFYHNLVLIDKGVNAESCALSSAERQDIMRTHRYGEKPAVKRRGVAGRAVVRIRSS